MPARGWWWKSREEEREREKWWAVRKRGHGCHAPRVKPTINREVKLLRYSLVHRSLAFARKSLHLSLCAKQPPPSFPWKYISVFPFPFFFLFPFFSLHEFTTNLPSDTKGWWRRNANRSRNVARESNSNARNALTHQKAIKRVSVSRASLFRSRGARSVPGHRGNVEKGTSRRRRRGS